MARTFEETDDGKYPASQHAPGCEDYKQIMFAKLTYDGSSVIVLSSDVMSIVKDSDCEDFHITNVELTQDQFDNLKDFQGW